MAKAQISKIEVKNPNNVDIGSTCQLFSDTSPFILLQCEKYFGFYRVDELTTSVVISSNSDQHMALSEPYWGIDLNDEHRMVFKENLVNTMLF